MEKPIINYSLGTVYSPHKHGDDLGIVYFGFATLYYIYICVCLYSNTQHDRIENHTEIVIDHVTIFFGLCYTRTHIDYERVFNIQCAVQCGVFYQFTILSGGMA